jgi:alpha-L-fucosidase 2
MKTQLFGYLSVASMGLDSLWVMHFLLALAVFSQCHASLTMWFNSTNIIPIGNGRLGAMIRGQLPIEQIVLNEDRIWSGHMNDPNPAGCAPILPTVQDLIWQAYES